MRVSITSISATSGGEEIIVSFELAGDGAACREQRRFLISSKQYLVLGLSKGVCDTVTFDSVAHEAEVWSCVKKGMSLLGYGACSEKALMAKLVSKGFGRPTAEEAVEHIVARGLICAEEDATREAQRRVAKLWGRRRIIAALYEKGYSSEAVSAAMCSLEDEGVDFVQSCRRLIEKRYGGVPVDAAEIKKMTASLQRYGYSISEIKQAASELM